MKIQWQTGLVSYVRSAYFMQLLFIQFAFCGFIFISNELDCENIFHLTHVMCTAF